MAKVLIALLLLLTVSVPLEAAEGVWVADPFGDDALWLSLSMRDRGHWMSSITVPLTDFEGLPSGVFAASGSTRVSFRLPRQAGAIALEGHVTDGKASGHFTFTPSDTFRRALRSEGFGDFRDRELLLFALHDTSTATIHALRDLGLDLDHETLLASVIHRVTPEWVESIRALDIEIDDAETAIAMRIHGVTPEYVREIRALGFSEASGEDLIKMRIHGVTPEFIQEMRALEIEAEPEEWIRMRIHGVDADLVKRLRAKGFGTRDPEVLIKARIHGVDRLLER